MELYFERGPESSRETRTLPPEYYNRLHLLFSYSPGDCLFVPIRSMQYLGVIDREEIIFVDGQNKHEIEISWQHFKAQKRTGIHEPVEYTCVYYREKGPQTMQRLHMEFYKALKLLEQRREMPKKIAKVTYLKKPG